MEYRPMTTDEIQAVYDLAYEIGILDQPLKVCPDDGVTAARIDVCVGEAVLIEMVAAR